MAVAVAVAARCLGAARSRCQPRCPSTTGTWRRSCWTPSTSRAGAAPGRAPTVTGEQGEGTARATTGCQGHRVCQRQRHECMYIHVFTYMCLVIGTFTQGVDFVCALGFHVSTFPGVSHRSSALGRCSGSAVCWILMGCEVSSLN
uniref:Uncharacterized protein n=1 Tax=Ficedula albicollis TaxID=59894 RepID=A0A803V0D3_FICAL